MEIEEFKELVLSGDKDKYAKAERYLLLELYKLLYDENKKRTAENSRPQTTLQEIISMLGLPTDDKPQSGE